VLEHSRDNYFVDYAYHLAPIAKEHIGEMDKALHQYGVPSFKIFMFYGGHGLHGASDSQQQFLMVDGDEK
jgi:allantoinase